MYKKTKCSSTLDWKIIFKELFPKKQTNDFKRYCFLSDELKTVIDEKHGFKIEKNSIIFHQDNRT